MLLDNGGPAKRSVNTGRRLQEKKTGKEHNRQAVSTNWRSEEVQDIAHPTPKNHPEVGAKRAHPEIQAT